MNLSTWCLVVIYKGYWIAVDYLQWDVKLILEFDYEETNTHMDSYGSHSELIFLDDTIYEGWMDFQFTFVYKGVLVIMEGCTGISEWYIWIQLID